MKFASTAVLALTVAFAAPAFAAEEAAHAASVMTIEECTTELNKCQGDKACEDALEVKGCKKEVK